MRFGFGLDMRARTFPAAAVPSIASLYGTGLGQVPLHLDPANAVMSGADVVSIPNSGGAGAALNSTANTTGITSSDNLLTFPDGNTTRWLNLPGTFNAIGMRLFFVARFAAMGTFQTLAGRSSGTGSGARTNIRLTNTSNGFLLQRWDGTIFDGPMVNTSAVGTVLHLFEVEMLAGGMSVWMDGQTASVALPTWPDFMIGRIFHGHSTPCFSGDAGDVVTLAVDGNQASQIATIRNALAAKHGLTLA